MPPKKDKEAAASVNFTPRDFDLLRAAMQSTKTPIEIDYKGFAERAGLGGAASAKASWHGLKKKLEKAGEGAVASTATAAPPEAGDKGGKKRKTTGDKNHDEIKMEESAEAEAAPAKTTKKARKTPAAKNKAKGKKVATPEPAAAEDTEEAEGPETTEEDNKDVDDADGEQESDGQKGEVKEEVDE